MDYKVFRGDCLDVMRGMRVRSVDSIVTDPPYGLKFMGKKWDCEVPGVEVWREALRVLKPGGHLLAFAGTRTQHRMCCNIEDAGFEIRDMLAWVYGSGFPKSLDIGKAIDKAAGAEREVLRRRRVNRSAGSWGSSGMLAKGEQNFDTTAPAIPEAKQWDGWGSALKPALEPITLARKSLSESTIAANVLEHGTGGLNVGGCRVGAEELPELEAGQAKIGTFERSDMVTPERVGRFPANLLHDGSPEVTALFPESKSKGNFPKKQTVKSAFMASEGKGLSAHRSLDDSGSVARFFYTAKASKWDREKGNCHPTVKPTDLMRYLCRLVTAPGGTVLDCFAGSGSTGVAAILEGFNFLGIERAPEYAEIAERRLRAAVNSGAQLDLF